MTTSLRTPLILLPLALAVLAGCKDRELPTAPALAGGPALSAIPVYCDAAELIAAIDAANLNPGPDEIALTAGCTYTLTQVNNTSASGNNGLPVITGDLTIHGNGATIARSKAEGTPAFRILHIAEGATVAVTGATFTGGHAFNAPDDFASFAEGGGIFNRGTLTLMHSTVSDNLASGFHASAGGIFNGFGGTLRLVHSTVSGNRASGAYVQGGGIAGYTNGTLTLEHSTVSGNVAFGRDLDPYDDSHSASGGGISSGGTVTITHSTVSNNVVDSEEAGFWGSGGGIGVAGTVTITRSTIAGNRVGNSANVQSGGSGGGIILGFTVTQQTITHSTISGNSVYGAPNSGGGGGIFVSSAENRTRTILNTTISGNTASGPGGGFFNDGQTRIIHCTITDNHAASGGGVWHRTGFGRRVEVKGGLIWGNTDGTIPDDVASSSGNGMFESLGYNLIGAAGANVDLAQQFNQAGDQSGVGAGNWLGALAPNAPGGTRTHALLTGSPAVDAGDCTDHTGATVTSDQRGVSRPQGSACDIGAYEYEPPAPPAFTFSGFFAPVANLPTVNVVRAGRAVPIKFSLDGDQGLNIFASGYPHSQQVLCNGGAAQGDPLEGTTAGSSSLSYDAAADQYNYVWKTERAWAGTCRELTLRLSDNTEHKAHFLFTN